MDGLERCLRFLSGLHVDSYNSSALFVELTAKGFENSWDRIAQIDCAPASRILDGVI